MKIKNLSFRYESNKNVVFDFEIASSRVTAIMGRSGVGKTTLLNLISGFQNPISGKVMYKDENILKASIQKRPISYLMQDALLFEHMTAAENIALGLCKGYEQDHYDFVIAGLGGQEFLNQRCDSLSGGQKQRVLLAQTLLQNREIILLDEPFKGLDLEQSKKNSIQVIKAHIKK